jgi:hypothetical protein
MYFCCSRAAQHSKQTWVTWKQIKLISGMFCRFEDLSEEEKKERSHQKRPHRDVEAQGISKFAFELSVVDLGDLLCSKIRESTEERKKEKERNGDISI